MFFVNTRNANDVVNFTQAVLISMRGLRSGLYVPSYVPTLDSATLVRLSKLSYKDILFEVIKIFCNNEISDVDIQQLINKAFVNFGKNRNMEQTDFELKDAIFDISDFDKNKFIVNGTYGPSGCIDDFGYYLCAEFINYLSERVNKVSTVIDVSLKKASCISTAMAVGGKKHLKAFILMDEHIDEISMETLSSNYSDNIVYATIDKNEDTQTDLQNLLYLNGSIQEQMNVSFIDGVNILNVLACIPFYIKIFHHNKMQSFVLSIPAHNATLAISAYIASLLGIKIAKIVLCCEKNYFFHNFQSSKTISFNQTSFSKNITDFTCDYPVNFERLLYYLNHSDQKSVFNKLEELFMEQTAKISDAIVIEFGNLFFVELCDNEFLIKKEMHNFLKKSGRFCDQNFALSIICIDNATKCFADACSSCNKYILECMDFRRNIQFIEDVVGFKIQNVKKMYNTNNGRQIETIKIGEYNERFIFQLIIDNLNKKNDTQTQQ